jgi:hypothetical protein
MSFELSFNLRDGYLEIGVAGPWSLENVYHLIDATRRECDRLALGRVLVDSRAMTGKPTEMGRFKGGVRTAEVLGGKIRVALVSRPDLITRFGENAAVNRGANLRVWADRDQALAWLLQGLPAAAAPPEAPRTGV